MKALIYDGANTKTIEGENLTSHQEGEFLIFRDGGDVVFGVRASDVLSWEIEGESSGRVMVSTEGVSEIYRENVELRKKIVSMETNRKAIQAMDKSFSDDLAKKKKPFWRR